MDDKEVENMFKDFFGVLLALIIVFGGSWILFNFILWLICLCFRLTFDILIGTGIWLCFIIVRWFVRSLNN